MPSTTSRVMIILDADDFMKIIADMQEEYNKQHGHTGADEDD